MLEVIVNVLDFDMNVQDAVDWPRFHHQWMPDELRVEPGYLARHRRAARKARLHGEARRTRRARPRPFAGTTAGWKAPPIRAPKARAEGY